MIIINVLSSSIFRKIFDNMIFVLFVTDSYWLAVHGHSRDSSSFCDTSVDSSGFGDDEDLEMCAGRMWYM
jgi:hypothetical protein